MAPVERLSNPSWSLKAGPWSKLGYVLAMLITVVRCSIRRWYVVTFLVLVIAGACSRSVPGEQPRIVTAEPEAPETRTVAMASVLVTSEKELGPPPITSIRISPGSTVADQGETIQLSAEAFGPDGQSLSDVDFVWTTIDGRVGSITREGNFQAGITPGVFDNSIQVVGIQNTPDGMEYASAFASISIVGEIQQPKLASVEIIPNNPTLSEQQIFRLRAVGFDDKGVVIPGVSFVWKLNDPRLGQLNELGYLTVHGDGGTYQDVVSVTGIWEGVRSSTTNTVRVISAPEAEDFLNVHALPQRFFIEPGDQLHLRAVALNGLGELVAGTELRWSMVDSRAGTIDGMGNFAAGESSGVYTEAVKVEAVVPSEDGFIRAVDFASVVIHEVQPTRRLSAISVVPDSVTLAPGGHALITVMAVEDTSEPAQYVDLSWEVVEAGVGEISALGSFEAGKTPGVYPDAIRVTAEQRLGEQVITRTKTVNVVITGTLRRAEVHPDVAVAAPGRTVHFSATGWDENGVVLPGLVVLWSVSDETAGTIDAFGNFTAGLSPGLYQDAIRAEIVQMATDLP